MRWIEAKHEIVGRVAILTDTDKRDGALFTPPAWVTDRDPLVVQAFHSSPTLEPAITEGNEAAVSEALMTMGLELPTNVTADSVDQIFQDSGKRRKGEFALLLGAELSQRLDAEEPVAVPAHFRAIFEYLYRDEEESDASSPPVDA
jgi:putative ATP-dependent endonuclease of OLD family